MITVRLPSSLRAAHEHVVQVHEPVRTIEELVQVLDRRIPGIKDQLDDAIFNFAVNDEMLLHGARHRTLIDGDVVEIVPAISGG
jgi:molybdopterin converting factor small subunit